MVQEAEANKEADAKKKAEAEKKEKETPQLTTKRVPPKGDTLSVGKGGLEPPTSRTRTVRASHLRYSPIASIILVSL